MCCHAFDGHGMSCFPGSSLGMVAHSPAHVHLPPTPSDLLCCFAQGCVAVIVAWGRVGSELTGNERSEDMRELCCLCGPIGVFPLRLRTVGWFDLAVRPLAEGTPEPERLLMWNRLKQIRGQSQGYQGSEAVGF